MLRALDRRGPRTKVSIQCVGQRMGDGRALDRREDAQCQAATRHQNTDHFAQRLGLIGKKLQTKLAKDQIEAAVGEWQIERTRLMPLDIWSGAGWPRSRDREHALIDIETDNMTRPHCRSRQARHNARAAGDVQNAFAWFRSGALDEVRSPQPSDCRNQITLVKLRGTGLQLPAILCLCHLTLPGLCRRAKSASSP